MYATKQTLAIALAVAACSQVSAQSLSESYREAFENAVAAPSDPSAAARLTELLPAVTSSFGPPRTFVVVEGDLMLDEDGLDRYRLSKKVDDGVRVSAGDNETELIVHLQDGAMARWAADRRTLRYSVLRGTFPDNETYEAVIADMKAAGQDWVDACAGCGIAFEYKPEFDMIGTWEEFQALTDYDHLRFAVIYNGSTNGPIASAFFPTDPVDRRLLSVFPSYFDLPGGYTGRGVMRHELGHVLGYRHEHTRGIPGCVFEDSSWVPVTDYDPKSVMHYWCGDAGTEEMELSVDDRAGHATNYAASPASDPN